jgi:7-cyano-7-deazaguanine synthase
MWMQPKAVILLSGGLDSTTCLAIAKADRYACYALIFDYQQRNRAEVTAAKQMASAMQAEEQQVLSLPALTFAQSALTDSTLRVPDFQGDGTIPITYVPARNTVFLAFALGYAEVIGAQAIYIGANSIDYPGYPDCRPAYLAAFQAMAGLATKAGVEGRPVRIMAPLVSLTKVEIIQRGLALGVDYSLTVSCYAADGQGQACGRCDTCHYRRQGFRQAGVMDPTRYTQNKIPVDFA